MELLVGDLHGEVGVQQLLDHLVDVLLLEEPAARVPRPGRRRRGRDPHAGIAGGRRRDAREHGGVRRGGGRRGGGVGLAAARLRGLHGREVEPVKLGDERGGEERRRGLAVPGIGGGAGVLREVGAHARAAHDARRLVVGARRVLRRLEGAQPDPRLPATRQLTPAIISYLSTPSIHRFEEQSSAGEFKHRRGWRISETQEPQWRCRTPRYRCCGRAIGLDTNAPSLARREQLALARRGGTVEEGAEEEERSRAELFAARALASGWALNRRGNLILFAGCLKGFQVGPPALQVPGV